ncbi:MAG: hypothetical protein RL385_4117, partial [Pseudomonadota bacterium]
RGAAWFKRRLRRLRGGLGPAGGKGEGVCMAYPLEVRAGEEAAAETLIRNAMEGAVSLRVPLVVGVGVGENWGDAH